MSKQSVWLRWALFAAPVIVGVATLWPMIRGASGSNDFAKLLVEYGYVELRPPSMLYQPGAWVEVRGRNPLRLSAICSPEDALGLTPEQLTQSASTDAAVTKTFSNTFDLGLEALGLGDLAAQTSAVKSIEMRLSRVRLIELSDDIIIKNISRRSAHCAEAIQLRYRNNPASVTMIDTVLIADAAYDIVLKSGANAQAKTELAEKIAARTKNLSIDLDRKDAITIRGSSLVWGVKDDPFMAVQGLVTSRGPAPSEGGDSLLRGSGPIQTIDPGQ